MFCKLTLYLMEKHLKSTYTVRFNDCDPLGHLNNARYLDYFLNAREDHLKDHYGLELKTYHQQGLVWVVGSHEIVYVKPAMYSEVVCIHSVLMQISPESLLVEMRMMDALEEHIKSVLWTRFIPVSSQTGKRTPHPEAFMDFARQIEVLEIETGEGLQTRVSRLIEEAKSKVMS